jgi:putative transposase
MRLMDATIAAGVKIENVTRWCEVNGVNRRTFYRHKQRVEAEGGWAPRSRRPATSPGATPAVPAAEIMRLRGELAPDNGADAIIAELSRVAARDGWERQGLRVPHRSTVNKVLKRAGLVMAQPQKRPKSSWRRFAYARPRDCYQIDATEVKLATGEAVVVFDVLDDCTRLLAACRAADAENGKAAVGAITAAAGACGAPGIVLCDNGAAFSGAVARGQGAFARAVTDLGARLIRSSPYHPQTCGKVERHHQTLKRWLAYQGAPAATLADLQVLLDAYREYYNTRRHHTAVKTTPQRAWDTAESRGGPGHLPRQDDATVHKLTVAPNGSIGLGGLAIQIGQPHAGTKVTAIRDNGHVTVYAPDGTPLGHLHLNHDKRYQGPLTPAA